MGNDILTRTNTDIYKPYKKLESCKSSVNIGESTIERVFGRAEDHLLKKNETTPCLNIQSAIK